MIVCIHCSLRAIVDGRRTTPQFDETIEQHMARMHPDYDAMLKERFELLDRLQDILAKKGESTNGN